MSGTVLSNAHMTLWHKQGQLYFILIVTILDSTPHDLMKRTLSKLHSISRPNIVDK